MSGDHICCTVSQNICVSWDQYKLHVYTIDLKFFRNIVNKDIQSILFIFLIIRYFIIIEMSSYIIQLWDVLWHHLKELSCCQKATFLKILTVHKFKIAKQNLALIIALLKNRKSLRPVNVDRLIIFSEAKSRVLHFCDELQGNWSLQCPKYSGKSYPH